MFLVPVLFSVKVGIRLRILTLINSVPLRRKQWVLSHGFNR